MLGCIIIIFTGDNDDGHILQARIIRAAHAVQQAEAIQIGHGQIRKYRLNIGVVRQQGPGIFPMFGFDDVIVFAKDLAHGAAHDTGIINGEDAEFGGICHTKYSSKISFILDYFGTLAEWFKNILSFLSIPAQDPEFQAIGLG